MLSRFTPFAVSFFVVLTTYWIYALLAVPWIEPQAVKRDSPAGGTPNVDPPAGLRKGPLGALFSEDSWELDNPKILESDRAVLLLRDYETLADGRVRLTPCTMIFFSRDEQAGQRRPIVMQAPEGAELEFDQPLDLRRGKIGNLIGGVLKGPILIRRRESSPGAGDDLRIETRDIQLAEGQVWTPHRVTFRLGSSYGSGSNMRIVLTPGEQDSPRAAGVPSFGGFDAFELSRDVRMHAELDGLELLPDDKPTGADHVLIAEGDGPGPNRQPPSAKAPLEITCQGPFRFDLRRYVATFEDRVDVTRKNAAGPSDHLSCHVMSIYFAPKNPGAGSTAATSSGLPPLRPVRLIARGDPVLVRSPSTGSRARCEQLTYDIDERRLRLEGRRQVELQRRHSEIRAASVDYRLGEPGRLGELTAQGPGWIRADLSDLASKNQAATDGAKKPSQFEASWQGQLRIRPHEGLKLISLIGRPQVRLAPFGSMTANEIWLWVREAAADEVATAHRAAGQSPSRFKVTPTKMLARGSVHVESPQLVADTGELVAWFQPQSEPSTGLDDSAGSLERLPPVGRGVDVVSSGGGEDSKPRRRYQCRCDSLHLELAIHDGRSRLRNATLRGNVELNETRTATPAETLLSVKGELVEVLAADTLQTTISIKGSPAVVEARQVAITAGDETRGGTIELDQGANRLWIQGPGSMTLPQAARRDALEQRRVESLLVAWQESMDFDGQTAICRTGVVVRTVQTVAKRRGARPGQPVDPRAGKQQRLFTQIETDRLEAALQRKIEFGQAGRGGADSLSRDARIETIECHGGFRLVNRTLEEGRLVSYDRFAAKNLWLNQRTGALAADGPGRLTSTRTGRADVALGRSSERKDRRTGADKDSGLTYLDVQFRRQLVGNLHDREMRFTESVRCVRGPVATWQSTIAEDAVDVAGSRVVLLNCDQLAVAEVPGAADGRSSLEFEASGNVSIEGHDFTAWASRTTYAEAKDLLVLEGTGRNDAVLTRGNPQGGSMARSAARKILYWPGSERLEVDDGRYLDLTQALP